MDSYQSGESLNRTWLESSPSGNGDITSILRLLPNNSSDEKYQPEFFKWSLKSSLQGYITDDLGIVASFVTTQANMPLKPYRKTDTGTYDYGNDLDIKRDNTRRRF